MGPCVRLVRALVAQPQPQLTEEESNKYWEEFKKKAKHEPMYLKEDYVSGEQSTKSRFCIPDTPICFNFKVDPIRQPSIDDDETLAGSTTLTYSDGSTEKAQVVHQKRPPPYFYASNSVETTILTPKRNIHLTTECYNKALSWLCSTKGTSITTDSDGSQNLAHVVVPPYIDPPK